MPCTMRKTRIARLLVMPSEVVTILALEVADQATERNSSSVRARLGFTCRVRKTEEQTADTWTRVCGPGATMSPTSHSAGRPELEKVYAIYAIAKAERSDGYR